MDLRKFKSGDRVRALKTSPIGYPCYIKDNIYTITSSNESSFLCIIGENGAEYFWYTDDFELAYVKEFSDKLETLVNE